MVPYPDLDLSYSLRTRFLGELIGQIFAGRQKSRERVTGDTQLLPFLFGILILLLITNPNNLLNVKHRCWHLLA